MEMYLVQHVQVKLEREPSLTPSEKGLKDTERVSVHVAKLGDAAYKICHRWKLRARQTAGILSEHPASRLGLKHDWASTRWKTWNRWLPGLKDRLLRA